jgi:diaminopimelate epimerase
VAAPLVVARRWPLMRRGTVFYKLTGSGNDFVALDGRAVRPEAITPADIRALCDRRHGAGADGLMVLDPTPGTDVHFRFHFWNQDGSPGPMCGNGALCATRLAVVLGIARPEAEIRFATDAGIHRGSLVGENQSEIALPDCDLPAPAHGVPAADGESGPMSCTPSVPHLVLEVPDVDDVDLVSRGPLLRSDRSLGPLGANVNWVSRNPFRPGWLMRTFERGVEGETLACGTGAVASALSLSARERAASPVTIWTRSGLPLDVSWVAAGGRAASIRLRGEGRVVYRAILESLPSQVRE